MVLLGLKLLIICIITGLKQSVLLLNTSSAIFPFGSVTAPLMVGQ